MALSVDWAGTKRIFVPRADMPVIQASPEVRLLDADAFRLELKNLEAELTEGIVWPDTHKHTTETTLSGIIYARFVEIINGYTVEFEAGNYGVSIVGANTNILDVKVANSVSILTNNSAGLVRAAPIVADVTTALDAQGLTATRAAFLDELDISNPASMAAAVALIRQITDGRLEIDFARQLLVLWNDARTVELRHWPISTDAGGADLVTTQPGIQTRRGPGVVPSL